MYYENADEWLRNHPAGWFLAAVIVPGSVIAGARLLFTADSIPATLFFGVTYATLSTVL